MNWFPLNVREGLLSNTIHTESFKGQGVAEQIFLPLLATAGWPGTLNHLPTLVGAFPIQETATQEQGAPR